MIDVIIVGAGGFGRELQIWLNDYSKKAAEGQALRLKGFISDNLTALDGYDRGVGILGDSDNYAPGPDERFLMAIGDGKSKKKVAEKLKAKGAIFQSFVHPSAIVASTAKLGEGVIVCPLVIVSDSVFLDDFSMLNFGSSCGHDSKIGKWSVLSPYAATSGFSVLEEGVFVGTHATVGVSVRVGRWAKISANSFAQKNVPEGAIVQGVPGKSFTLESLRMEREAAKRDPPR